ncbi:MAG TPA: septal ring lytic transglycosylase RlpA family protein [Stellaceae bacterium]|nr:septal ring lytic transglycosylase RlpA family protein [Stellaceae bacterium]
MSRVAQGRLILAAAAGFLLAGCAAGPQYGGGYRHYVVGQPHYTIAPYAVNGVWYYPAVDYNYDRTGTASWYGPGFDHRPTADGEIYDMNDLTAAHKTLPLPSVVEVTNLQNGRALTLRVNDRGPFIGDRLIDVSRRAAQLLGFERTGTAPVRVRILKEPSIEVAEAAMLGEMGPVAVADAQQAQPVQLAAAAPPPVVRPPVEIAAAPPAQPAPLQQVTPPPLPQEAAPPPRREFAAALPRREFAATPPRRDYWPSLIAPAEAATLYPRRRPPRLARRAASPPAGFRRIFIQAGAFSVPGNARWVRAQIARLGSTEIVPGRSHGVALYQVRLGPVRSDAEALRLLSAVLDRGFAGARLVEE